jgi:hypothetical protein
MLLEHTADNFVPHQRKLSDAPRLQYELLEALEHEQLKAEAATRPNLSECSKIITQAMLMSG